MNTRQMEKLDIKIEFTKLVISDLEAEYREAEGVDRLLLILETYEQLLLRTKFKIATDLDDLNGMRKGVRDAASLRQDMTINEPELMHGWHHGATPKNKAHALASMLARIMLECMEVVEQFETKYSILKTLLDAGGEYQEPSVVEAE